MSPQDKIMHVANKLGLTSLKDMQGSTGAVYDVDIEGSGLIFNNASQHAQPQVANINENKFEVNEALLVESIAFYGFDNDDQTPFAYNLSQFYNTDIVILFDLVIGNKRVMKDTPVFIAGQPSTFATSAVRLLPAAAINFAPRHQIFMEGAGILIPPQVEWSINYKLYNLRTGAIITPTLSIGAYLFGTRVLLNFNTTI
jgi:hypothetical protein